MKNHYLSFLILTVLFSACSSPSEELEQIDKTKEKTNHEESFINSVKVGQIQEPELIDMHPKIDYLDYNQESELTWPELKYFNGDINGEEIALILEPFYGSGKYSGRYIYKKNGSNFEIEAKMNTNRDSIVFTRLKNGNIREQFIGSCDFNLTFIKGIWIKDNDTSQFKLNEQVNSPEQTQVFVNIENYSDMYNTIDGIANIPGTSDMEEFNSFTFLYSMGSAYDFGEEWSNHTDQVFFLDSTIVYINSDIDNTISTIFENDKSPNGPDDYDEDAIIGEEKYCRGEIIISVIKNGISVPDTIVIEEEFVSDTWLFQNYIVISDDDSEKSIVYKWDDNKKGFEKIK